MKKPYLHSNYKGKVMKRILFSTLILASALAGTAQVNNYSVGDVVDDFTITDVDGNVHNLYAYADAGKYIILDFFFDTCPPCQATAPFFNELHDTYGCNSGDLICLTINNGTDNDAMVIAYEQAYGGSFNHAPAISADGGGGEVNANFGINAFPTYCMVGPNRTLVNADIWPVSDMNTFVSAFPAGSGISPMACSVNVAEPTVAISTPMNVFPNPANGNTNITYSLANDARVRISIVNLVGEEVMVVTEARQSAGEQRFVANLSQLSKGVYMVRFQQDNKTTTQRLIVQ
ncbi:MAG: T9SS type A sorting domain-containing protein [Cryomorphaceae bacterium]|nr:T9SS type A sorting domain-containing protein [Cryomorphaceae bacterium]